MGLIDRISERLAAPLKQHYEEALELANDYGFNEHSNRGDYKVIRYQYMNYEPPLIYRILPFAIVRSEHDKVLAKLMYVLNIHDPVNGKNFNQVRSRKMLANRKQ